MKGVQTAGNAADHRQGGQQQQQHVHMVWQGPSMLARSQSTLANPRPSEQLTGEDMEDDSDDMQTEKRSQTKDRPRKPHLQGRFSGRLETKVCQHFPGQHDYLQYLKGVACRMCPVLSVRMAPCKPKLQPDPKPSLSCMRLIILKRLGQGMLTMAHHSRTGGREAFGGRVPPAGPFAGRAGQARREESPHPGKNRARHCVGRCPAVLRGTRAQAPGEPSLPVWISC